MEPWRTPDQKAKLEAANQELKKRAVERLRVAEAKLAEARRMTDRTTRRQCLEEVESALTAFRNANLAIGFNELDLADRLTEPRTVSGHRRHIPREVKIAVYERCGGRCVECEATYPLHIDHMVPLARGGSDGVSNLQVLCDRCNLRKGARQSG